ALALFTVSALVLLGWRFDIHALKSIVPGFAHMKANSAAGFLAFAICLACYSRILNTGRDKAIIFVFALFAGFLGAATLFQHITQLNLGIDEFLFLDPQGRMSPVVAICFILTSLSFLYSLSENFDYLRISQLLGIVVLIVSFQTFAGYLVGLGSSQGPTFYNQMALVTSSLFIVTNAALLNLQRRSGIVQVLSTDTVGSRTARRLIFYALCVLPLANWLEDFIIHDGPANVSVATMVRMLINTASFVWLVWQMGKDLRKADQDKMNAESMRNASLAEQERLQRIITTQVEIAQAGAQKEDLMGVILRSTEKLTGMTGTVIEMIDGDELCYVAASGTASHFLGMRLKIEGSFSGRCITSGQVMYCRDSETDDRVNRPACRKIGLRSMIVVPLITNQKLVGVLKTYSAVPDAFGSTELNTLQLLAGLLGSTLATANAFQEKEAAIQALQASEKKLTEERERADVATNAKSQFFATLSHEIRTPLNGVIGTSELLLDTPLEAEQKELAETIRTCGDTLLFLINDILDFSKIEAKKLDLEKIDFSLVETFGQIHRTMEFMARRKGLELKTELLGMPAPRFYQGDPGRLRQVLLNLLSNSIKFTASGSVTLKAREQKKGDGETEFRIEVVDTGIGISAESQAKLFQPFAQADVSTTRKYGGTGLGLSISHSLVQLMGGDMGVTSELGKGATFWFTLPLKHGHAPPKPKEDTAVSTRPMKVLVVDDNRMNQILAERMLKKLGHSVVSVDGGPEALRELQEKTFDLVLMDCQMPGMDGFEATRVIRQRERKTGAYTMIVALTANASREDEALCLKSGMDAFCSKPITVSKLQSGIELALGRQAETKVAA
ncbi:response regulator, partial [bacterium]|nr:response regulator [bacterium]